MAITRRAFFGGAAACGLGAAHERAVAQESRRVPKIGLLFVGSPDQDVSERARSFREGMSALGWVGGRTVHYEFRFASGRPERLAAHAAELAALPVDIIAAIGTAASLAARRASGTIPVVMLGVGDPVGAGLVTNLANPGGNVTGTSLMLRETQGKNLELLKEAIPRLKRVAVIHTNDRWFALARAAAARLGLETESVLVKNMEDARRQFDAFVGAEAIWVLADPVIDELRGEIAELSIRNRLPSMGPLHLYAEAGFLFSYSANVSTLHGRGAYYADRILKGARAGDLPIEQPTKFEFIVNLKTARKLGFDVPPSLLVRADRVIE